MEPKAFSHIRKQHSHRLAELEAFYLSSLSAGNTADDNTSKYYQLLGEFASPIHQPQYTSENAAGSMSNYDQEEYYYPTGKIYDILGKYTSAFIEHSSWYNHLKESIDMLNEKLCSARLANLDELWYNGFEDLELKKLERSLLTVQVVLDDIKREEKELKVWKVQHRHLKELLCEVDELLDDIALRAPQLKQLLQSRQVTPPHPYLTDKLSRINNFIQELNAIAVEIKSMALPEFNTRRRKPPGPVIRSNQPMEVSPPVPNFDILQKLTQGNKNHPDTISVGDEVPVFYTFVGPQGTSRATVKDEQAANNDKIMAQSYDIITSASTEEDMGRKSKDTETTDRRKDRGIEQPIDRRKKHDTKSMERQYNSVIYDEEPPPTSSRYPSMPNTITSIHDLPNRLQKCLLYTSLFPGNYEFEKEMVIQMWVAAGYIESEGNKLMEDTACDYFDELLSMGLFEVSTLDESRYILPDDAYKMVHESSVGEYARLEDGNLNGISKATLHSSVLYESNVDPMIFKSFHKFKGLHSLLLLHETRINIKQIPYDLFLSLRCIHVLDLSGTRIKELPTSVGNLKTLHYLDLSETRIRSLPQSISRLSGLQILKLKECLNFVELPKNMKDLISLRHLELDILRQLTFMPQRMGRLTNLQTLNAFIAGKRRGSQIAELKHMNNLRGSLRIVKLENVLTVEDAEEAALYDKQYLRKLELQWSLACLEAVEVLEGLQPHTNLTDLEIVSYGGTTFPPWLGDSSFSKLTNINIYNCKNVTLLPLLGRLPSLKSLHIVEMHAIERIDGHIFGGSTKGFSKLETLHLDGMHALEEWTGIPENGMPCLLKLTIVDCPLLVKLPELSNLKSLQYLEVSFCFELPSLVEKRLQTALQKLIITDCPKLKEAYQKEGDEWHKIADVPNIWIDYQLIS